MKRILAITSFVIGSMIILLLVLVLTYRDRIMHHAVDYITEQVEAYTGYQIQCGNIQLAFPMSVQIECVKVFSQEHPQLFIDNLEVQITPWGALRRHIVIDKVKIGTLSVLAAPDLSTPNTIAWDLFPGSLKIETLLIERLHVAPKAMSDLHLSSYASLVSEEIPMRITGRWAVNPFEKTVFADFLLSRTAQPANQTHLIASLSQPGNELEAYIRIAEAEHGIISDQFDLPQGYTFQGILHAKGAPSVWHQMAFPDPADSSTASLTGDFQFNYASSGNSALPFLGKHGFVKGPFTLSRAKDRSSSLLYGKHLSRLLPQKPFRKYSPVSKPLDSTLPHKDYHLEAGLDGLIGSLLLQGNLALTSQLKCDGTKLQFSIRNPIEIESIKAQNIQADCALSGDLFSPNIDFQLKNDALEMPHFQLKQIVAHGKMECALDVLSGVMDASFQHEGKEWQASSSITLNTMRQIIGLSHLQLNSGLNRLAGDLQIDFPRTMLNGDLEGDTDLSLFQDLIDVAANGPISWKAHLYHQTYEGSNSPVQALDLFIKSNQLQIDKLIADESNISLSLDNPFADPSGIISLTCKHAVWENWEGRDLSGETIVKLDSKRWPFSFSGKRESLEIFTKGSWHWDKNQFQCNVDVCEGSLEEHAFALQDPVHASVLTGSITISPVLFSIGQGSCYAAVESPTGYIQAVGRIKELPLDLLRIINPELKVQGSATGGFFLIDSSTGIEGNMHLNVADAEVLTGPYATPNPWHASFKADLHNDILECKGHLAGVAPNPIELSATLPVAASFTPFSFNIEKQKPLSAHLLAQGDIESLLERVLPVTTTNLTGQTTLAVNVQGTMEAPQITGQMDLINGTFEILDIGASLKNVKAHFNINGTKLTMTELTSMGQESGTIIGSGTAELNFEKAFPFDFSFKLDKLGLRPFNYMYVTASGPLRMTGDAKGGALSGKITSNSLQMTIPEKIPELAQTIQVKYINQPSHLPAPTVFVEKESKWPLTFNVALEIPRQGMINGRDWTSEWKGNATLTGNKDHWEMHGTCKIIRGEYRFNGKSFEINQGTITFAGEPDKKTSLYVIASKDIESIHAEIILKGDINHPAIAFRSNPPMPQREIISWILFNRGTSDITSFQGTQLNESITEINTSNRQPDMLSQIRERFGVDKIGITNEENGDTNQVSLQVGKYISKGVLVSVQKSINAEANSLSIEADLVKHFKLQAEIDDEADAQLRLKWKKDY